jgi:hypothetical protein
MGIQITEAGKALHERYKKLKSAKKTAKENIGTVQKLLDEDTRSGELFKLGVKYGVKGLEALGLSITSNFYFKYHKAHMEALVAVLNASDTHANATKALLQAADAADAAEVLTKSLDGFTNRKKALVWEYQFYLAGSLRTLSTASRNPAQAANDLKDIGQTADSLRATVANDLFAWRAHACELYFDAVELLAMVEVEYRTAAEAMARYDAKMKKLQNSTKAIDTVARLSLERNRQYEEFTRDPSWSRSSSKSSPQAVRDPTGWAKQQRDKVEAVTQVLATICDTAMSDTAYDPDALNRTIGNL